jgi:hypothetical protein
MFNNFPEAVVLFVLLLGLLKKSLVDPDETLVLH